MWVPQEKSKPAPPFEDFRIPDFGLEKDVVDTLAHSMQAEADIGHTWTPTQDENGVWQVPKPIDNASYTYKSLLQTDAQISRSKKHKSKKHHHHKKTHKKHGKKHGKTLAQTETDV